MLWIFFSSWFILFIEMIQAYYINISSKQKVLPEPLTLLPSRRASNYTPLWIRLWIWKMKSWSPVSWLLCAFSKKLNYGFHHYLAEVKVVNVNISQETIYVDNVPGRLQWNVNIMLCFIISSSNSTTSKRGVRSL